MSVYRDRMGRAETKTRARLLWSQSDLKDAEDVLLERDLARVLERLEPLEGREDGEAAIALRAHLEATAQERSQSDPEIVAIDHQLDELRKARAEKRKSLSGLVGRYEAQVRLEAREIEWDEVLEGAGLSHRLPRSRGSRGVLIGATIAITALELGLLSPPLMSYVREKAPSWGTTWVALTAATIIAVLVGAGAGAVLAAGRQYKEYQWAKIKGTVASELNGARVASGMGPIPVATPEVGSLVLSSLAALFVQSILFIMRFITEDTDGQMAQLAVVVSLVATVLPIILFVLEKDLHDPKSHGPQAYDRAVITQYEMLEIDVNEHIPRELARFKGERELRGQLLLLEEVAAIRKHALSLRPGLVATLDEMSARASANLRAVRSSLEIEVDGLGPTTTQPYADDEVVERSEVVQLTDRGRGA